VRRATLKPGIWNWNLELESGTRIPESKIQNLESRNWIIDIENDERNNSLQQYPINN